MSLPQSNATVTQITAAGPSEDWDADASSGATRFAGQVAAYVQEKLQTLYSSGEGALRKIADWRLYLPLDLEVTSPVVSGDTVTFEYQGVTHSMRVQEVQSKSLQGVPNLTMTLHLDPQPVEA